MVSDQLGVHEMVDYSKWDNLDSESSSDSDGTASQQQQKQPTRQQRHGVQQGSSNSDTNRILEQAENLRYDPSWGQDLASTDELQLLVRI